jgi:hypothetical protein
VPPRNPSRLQDGITLPEVLLVLLLLGLMAGLGAGPLREGLGRARLRSAAVELARRMSAARWRAVSGRASVGLRFEVEPDGGWRVATYRDGDGDGIRSADIASGKDYPLGTIFRPGEGRGGVRFGIPSGPRVPRIPPSRGWLDGGGDPVRFGASDIVSFSPLGSVTPGSAYLTDGSGRLAGVVVFGATARIRVRLYHRDAARWRP